MNLVEIPSEKLHALYFGEGLSAATIAKLYGCCPSTVFYKLQRAGVSLRPRKVVNIGRVTLIDLYCSQKLSMAQIAKRFECSPTIIFDKLHAYRIPARDAHDEIYQKLQKLPFSGDMVEKAYLLGFRLGDLYARAGKNAIYVKTNTTRSEQVRLMHVLFSKYGQLRSVKTKQFTNMEVWLHKSFLFLAPKKDEVPQWVLVRKDTFLAFLAGYTDAEGNIGVYSGRARVRIGSYDIGILAQIHKKLLQWGIHNTFRLETPAGTNNQNKDFWRVCVNDRSAIKLILELLEPYLLHPKRRKDLKAALLNVNKRIGDNCAKTSVLHNHGHRLPQFYAACRACV